MDQVKTETASQTQYGKLAQAWCKKRLPLQVCKSFAGYYIGTLEDGLPCSRESVEYWPTNELAEQALQTNQWTQKQTP